MHFEVILVILYFCSRRSEK